MGSTNIIDPIKFAISINWRKNWWKNEDQKRIFMLTDGWVDSDREGLIKVSKGTN